MFSSRKYSIGASLEPDADNDGFGDETQDGCKGQTGANNGCIAQTCRVPKLKGLTKAKAKSALQTGGCKLGKSKSKKLRKFTKKQKRNRVRSQSVKANTFLPGGASVNITINKKK